MLGPMRTLAVSLYLTAIRIYGLLAAVSKDQVQGLQTYLLPPQPLEIDFGTSMQAHSDRCCIERIVLRLQCMDIVRDCSR